MVIYLDLIFGMNVLFNFFILLLTNYITKAYRKKRILICAAIFGSFIVPLELLVTHPIIQSQAFKWFYCLLIILFAFGYNGFYQYVKYLMTFLLVMFTLGGGIYGIQQITRESEILHHPLFLMVKNIRGESVSLLLLFIFFPILLLAVKRNMDRHVKDKMHYDQICEVALQLDTKLWKTNGYIDSGNQLQDPFSGRPVVICDQMFLQQFFSPQEWKNIVAGITTGETDLFPEVLRHRLTIVPYQGVGGASELLYAFKPDQITVCYDGTTRETSKVLVGIQTANLTVDGSYHCLLHPGLIRLNMKQTA